MAINKESIRNEESFQKCMEEIIRQEYIEFPPAAELPVHGKILGSDTQIEVQYPDTVLAMKTWNWAVPAEASIIETTNSLMPLAQRYLLWSIVYGTSPSRYLEIGSDAGGSALIVAGAIRALSRQDFRGVCIDPSFHMSDATREYLGENFFLIESKNSPESMVNASRWAGGLFDLILVDGDHTYDYALTDIFLSYSYLSPGGYMLVDDAAHPQVRDAIAYALENLQLIDCGFMCRHAMFCEIQIPPTEHHQWQGEKMMVSGLYVLRKPLRK